MSPKKTESEGKIYRHVHRGERESCVKNCRISWVSALCSGVRLALVWRLRRTATFSQRKFVR